MTYGEWVESDMGFSFQVPKIPPDERIFGLFIFGYEKSRYLLKDNGLVRNQNPTIGLKLIEAISPKGKNVSMRLMVGLWLIFVCWILVYTKIHMKAIFLIISD